VAPSGRDFSGVYPADGGVGVGGVGVRQEYYVGYSASVKLFT